MRNSTLFFNFKCAGAQPPSHGLLPLKLQRLLETLAVLNSAACCGAKCKVSNVSKCDNFDNEKMIDLAGENFALHGHVISFARKT